MGPSVRNDRRMQGRHRLGSRNGRHWACGALLGALCGVACGSEAPSSRSAPLAPLQPALPSSPATAEQAPSEPLAPEAPKLDVAQETSATPQFFDEASPAPQLAPEDACAATAIAAESVERVVEVPVEEQVTVPSVFYLMLDSSGSMVSDPFTLAGLVEAVLDLFGLGQRPPQPTKWDYTLDGLNTFLNDPASAGLELGLGYFPDGGVCDGSGYDVPSVSLGVLPEQAPVLGASLMARQPVGNTPLEGALRGVTNYCLRYNAEHPDASCVAVLITDGAADECDARSASDLAAIAASAREGGVITYAAGMQGADFGVLDAIGAAGGGDCDPEQPGFACDLTANRQALVTALDSIRDRTRTQLRIERHTEVQRQVLPCEWQLPAAPSGAALDPERVNVRLSLGAAGEDALSQVAEASSCGDAGGWYYDDPSAPAHILACPASCDALRAEPEARVDLLLGCKTVLR
jgi:hypothetical protein